MIRLKPNIILDYSTGETFVISDYTGIYDAVLNTTGYGAPNLIASQVNAVRFIFNTYLKEQQRDLNSTAIAAGVEYYVAGTGNFTYDTKTYNAGDTFISMLDGTPTLPGTITLQETGRFQPVSDFVPLDVTTPDFTPSLLGINSTKFPDTVGNVQYDVFTTEYEAGVNRPAGTYYVKGTPGQTVTVGSVTYRVGEVFTQGSTFTTSGAGSIVLFSNTTTDANGDPDYVYFLFGYHAFQALIDMAERLSSSCCPCLDKLKANSEKAWNIWIGITNQFAVTDGTIDISGIQSGLEEIVNLNATSQC